VVHVHSEIKIRIFNNFKTHTNRIINSAHSDFLCSVYNREQTETYYDKMKTKKQKERSEISPSLSQVLSSLLVF
jgi:GGDEF domain-containing protein